MTASGTVKFFNEQKGFGFITSAEAVMRGSWSPGVCVGVLSMMIGRCNGS